MQVKIFEADDMASGLKMIRNELGPEALILSTRSIRSGKLGILGKPKLEITAAVDSAKPVESKPQIKTPEVLRFRNKKPASKPANPYDAVPKANTARQNIDLRVNEPIEPITYNFAQQDPLTPKQAETSAEPVRQTVEQPVQQHLQQLAPQAQPQTPRVEDNSLRDEMNELKSLVKNLSREISRLHTPQQPAAQNQVEEPMEVLQGVQNNILPKKSFDNPVINLLLKQGINLETSTTIANFTEDALTEEILQDKDQLRQYLQTTISSLIQTRPISFDNTDDQQRIALIGPTGVGKTTTLAKLAAKYISEYSNSIALITIDTYRIAAVEQLKVYGDIMNLPVEVVITPQELEHALISHRDKDLILIDTAGRSPKDNFCIEELSTFLTPELDIQKHLVLSSTTRESEIISTIQQFENLGIDQTIMTKIDECHNLGVLLNVQIQNPNPISFVTNGQRVPEDILAADQQVIAGLIMSTNEG